MLRLISFDGKGFWNDLKGEVGIRIFMNIELVVAWLDVLMKESSGVKVSNHSKEE